MSDVEQTPVHPHTKPDAINYAESTIQKAKTCSLSVANLKSFQQKQSPTASLWEQQGTNATSDYCSDTIPRACDLNHFILSQTLHCTERNPVMLSVTFPKGICRFTAA